MRHATLLYNPRAGSGLGRAAVLRAVKDALLARGVDAALIPTEGPGTAGTQAAMAAKTSEVVFACGGDGTVHEVLQGLAGDPSTVLGVLPLGSANVLARHLQLPLNPVAAALAQLQRAAAVVPVGRVSYHRDQVKQSRFFLSVAGAGADGLLAYRTLTASKQRLGQWAYPLQAAQLALSRRAPFFPFEGTQPDGTHLDRLACSVFCSRVASVGGLLRPLVASGSVEHAALSITVVEGPTSWPFPLWFAASWTGLRKRHRHRRHHLLETLTCGEGLGSPVYVQADGEWLGQTPMRLEVVHDALRLFLPAMATRARQN